MSGSVSSSDNEEVFSPTGATTVARLDVPLMDSRWMGKRGRHFSTDSTSEGMFPVPHREAQAAKTLIEHVSLLNVFTKPHIVRNTGIICTIGKLDRLFGAVDRCLNYINIIV